MIYLGNLMGDVQLVAYPLTDKERNVQIQITKWKLCFSLCMDFFFFPLLGFEEVFYELPNTFLKVFSVLVRVSLKETPFIWTM